MDDVFSEEFEIDFMNEIILGKDKRGNWREQER
jgi:hypothetical protein